MSQKKENIIPDLILYLSGAGIPMLLLFLRSPIYTRIFTPQEYGQFALINITFTYISATTFNWIQSCAMRYYNRYIKTNKEETFYSLINSLSLISGLIFILIATTWFLITPDTTTKKLLIWGTLFFISEKYLHLSLTPLRLNKKAARYNIIKGGISFISFGLLLTLTFLFNFRIESFFIAPAILNLIAILLLAIFKQINLTFRLYHIHRIDLKRFLKYGSTSLGFAICLFLLISSDRYIIALYYSSSEVGIYNQVYNIAQVSLAALINIFQAATNPYLIKLLEEKPGKSGKQLSGYVYMAVFLYLPATIFGILFSQELAFMLLGEKFRIAWDILPWVFASTFITGIIHFQTIKLKFSNKLKSLLAGGFIAAGANIILNIVFLPEFGYKFAAITTLLSYSIMFLYFALTAKEKVFYINEFKKEYLILILVSICIVTSHYVIRQLFPMDQKFYFVIIEVVVLLLIYYLSTYKFSPFKSLNKRP